MIDLEEDKKPASYTLPNQVTVELIRCLRSNKFNPEQHTTIQNVIFEGNRGLVSHRVEVKFSHTNFGEDFDLVEIGYLGLLSAIQGFDPDRRIRFSSYAGMVIDRTILREVRKQLDGLRTPERVHNMRGHIRRVKQVLIQEKRGWEPTEEEISQRLEQNGMNYTPLQIRATRKGPIVHLGGTLNKFGKKDKGLEDLEVLKAEEVIRGLSPLYQRLITLRFGLNGAPIGLAAISKLSGVDRATLRRLEHTALLMLRGRYVPPELNGDKIDEQQVLTALSFD
ncbi:MAG: sigma-70 family RNA polymerase sigma factor [Candidatus Woesearchaeota archaeon]|nr:MAG: sigma-70 family RNA polymerase sigma factor [Candidatus Woesearchaeota archaeon]